MTPVEQMLQGVDWQRRDPPATPGDEMPYVTHSGVLEIGGAKLRCYRLNDGRAIFDADDVRSFFGGFLQ